MEFRASAEGQVFEAAVRRIASDSPLERLRWVLVFSQVDLATLDATTWAGCGYYLGLLPYLTAGELLSGGGFAVAPMPLETLRAIQGRIRTGLHALLVEGQPWALGPIEGGVLYPRPPQQGGARFEKGWLIGADAVARILHAVGDHVRWHGHRLRACRECQHPFIAVKRQQYCQSQGACSQRARDRKRNGKGSGK